MCLRPGPRCLQKYGASELGLYELEGVTYAPVATAAAVPEAEAGSRGGSERGGASARAPKDTATSTGEAAIHIHTNPPELPAGAPEVTVLDQITLNGRQFSEFSVVAPPGKLGVSFADTVERSAEVNGVSPDSPLAGVLSPEDRVLAVDDTDTASMSMARLIAVIGGKADAPRTFTVRSARLLSGRGTAERSMKSFRYR